MDDRGSSDVHVSIHPAAAQYSSMAQPCPRPHVIVPSVPNSACPRRKKMPSDEIPRKLLRLLLELIASGELPELAVGGVWGVMGWQAQSGRPALKEVALEADVCGLAVAGLRTVGSAADWVVSIVSSLVSARIR